MVKSKMEAAVVDPGSKLLKAGPAIPDQAPSMVNFPSFCFHFLSPLRCSEKFLVFWEMENSNCDKLWLLVSGK